MDTTVKDPLVGRVLDGRYRVQSRLARGGMATVYEAVDSRLDRTIALKVMHPTLAEDDEFVSRFIREARAAARLSHPNVVAVYDQGADGGHVFLAMEYVAGRTLRDLLRERGPLSPRQALELTEGVLAALGAAHQAGIVHRDVKPENVLLSDDGRVKVADFGLARAVTGSTTHSTTTGILMGTVAYLSPEQVERGVADPRSDVYSAGILLFEMLTGEKPFDGETAIQVAYRHVHDDVPPPSELVPGLPPEVDALVARATSRDPDQRPADANRFLTEVVRVRRGLDESQLDQLPAAVAVQPSTPDHTLLVPFDDVAAAPARSGDTGPLPKAKRRSRRGWIALLLILALAAALSGAAWYVAAGPGAYTSAPSLLGLSQAQAKSKANHLGFHMQVTDTKFSESVPVDHVISTSPAPNGRIQKNGTIEAVLSKGPERYAVPAVAGRAEEAARRMITDGHLSVGTVKRKFSDTVDEGRIISTNPSAGTRLKPETVVTLVVSKGVAPVAVPDVVGKSEADARSALAQANLLAVVAGQRFDMDVPAGAVIRQSPSADATAPKGSKVELVISRGPPLVQVPDVVGMPVDEATKVLQDAGFHVSAFGPSIGRVFSQRPGGGSTAPKGSTVTLFYI